MCDNEQTSSRGFAEAPDCTCIEFCVTTSRPSCYGPSQAVEVVDTGAAVCESV